MAAAIVGLNSLVTGGIMYGAASYTKLANPGQAFVTGVVGSLLIFIERRSVVKKESENNLSLALAILGVTFAISNVLAKPITFQATLGLGASVWVIEEVFKRLTKMLEN